MKKYITALLFHDSRTFLRKGTCLNWKKALAAPKANEQCRKALTPPTLRQLHYALLVNWGSVKNDPINIPRPKIHCHPTEKTPHRIRAPEILVAIDPHRCDSRSLQATGCWWRIKSGVAYKPQNGSMMDWSIRLWAKGLIFKETGTSTSNGYHKSLWPAWSRLRHWRHPHRRLRRRRGGPGCRGGRSGRSGQSGRRLGQGHPAWRNKNTQKKNVFFPTSTASTVLLSSSASQWLWLMVLTEFGS